MADAVTATNKTAMLWGPASLARLQPGDAVVMVWDGGAGGANDALARGLKVINNPNEGGSLDQEYSHNLYVPSPGAGAGAVAVCSWCLLVFVVCCCLLLFVVVVVCCCCLLLLLLLSLNNGHANNKHCIRAAHIHTQHTH